MKSTRFPAALAAVLILLVAATFTIGAGVGDPKKAKGQPGSTSDYEQIVYVDYGQPFHGGPPPHSATDAATDFHLDLGGISWTAAAVKYTVDATNCSDDCGAAVSQVDAAMDTLEVSGITLTRDDASPDANLCGGFNSVAWASIDGSGGILAIASVCRTVATKVIVGFAITFDADDTWSDSGDSGKFDIQAVGAHEAGHAVGLGHVNAPRAQALTMFRTTTAGDAGPRTLGCGDRLGINALYGTALDCTGLPGD